MISSRFLKYPYDLIATAIKSSAHKHERLIQPTVAAIGTISENAERKVREKLSIPPTHVSIDRSPMGRVFKPPIRMSTCKGQDQISKLIYYRGWRGFEHSLPSLIEQILILAPDGLFFDIGANTGLYSLLSKAVRPNRGVHAFEPFPPAFSILKDNLALNSFATNVILVDVALSDGTGTAKLFIPTQEHGLVETSASLSSTFRPKHSDVIEVKTISLDDYCRQGMLNTVSIMKIDVEGVEDRVISGASEIIARDKPTIFCEILPNAGAWKTISSILEPVGYLRASIRPKDLMVRDILGPDPEADNYILFPENSKKVIRDAAHLIGMRYNE